VASPDQKEFTKTCLIVEGWHLAGTALACRRADSRIWPERIDGYHRVGFGGLMAFYQIGYGIAAFDVGPLQTWQDWT
jgi:hypothetical protein